jgi:hypothetical protein
MFPSYLYRNARDYPSPDKYNVRKEFAPVKSGRGRTFGLSHESFGKVFL